MTPDDHVDNPTGDELEGVADFALLATAVVWVYQLIGHPIGAALGALIWFKFVWLHKRREGKCQTS